MVQLHTLVMHAGRMSAQRLPIRDTRASGVRGELSAGDRDSELLCRDAAERGVV